MESSDAGVSRFAVLENPVFRLEMRQVWNYLRRPWRCLGGWRWHMTAPARRVAAYIIWLPFTIAAPYLMAALMRFTMGHLAGAQAPPLPFDFSALVVYSYALFGGLGLVQMGAFSFAQERDQGVLESLVLCRLTAAEVVLGKAAALALPTAGAATVAFAVWLLFPPLTDTSSLLGFRFDQSPRALLACLWLDALTTSAAGAFIGVAVSAWCRSSRSAASGAMLVTLPLVLLITPLMLAGAPMSFLSPQVTLVPASFHPVVWALSGVAGIAAFIVAQVRLEPVPVPVTLIPGGRTRVRLSSGGVTAALALVVVALLAGGGLAGQRAMRSFVATTNAFSPSGKAAQALSLARQGKHAQALPLLDAEIGRGVSGPLGAMLWDAKAECHLGLRQYRKAAAAYDEMRRVSPRPITLAASRRGIGDCLLAMGKRKEAAAAYREALRLMPQATPPGAMPPMMGFWTPETELWRVARGLASSGHRSEAVQVYESVVKLSGVAAPRRVRLELTMLKEGLDRAPRLGIRYREDAPTTVQKVNAGSGAAAAGIQAGDRILMVDGRPIDGSLASLRILARRKPGDVVPVVVERAGKQQTYRVRLSAP